MKKWVIFGIILFVILIMGLFLFFKDRTDKKVMEENYEKAVFNFGTKTVKLNSGYEMPLNGLGTYSLTGDECYNSVKSALEAGVRLFDTAYMYNNEEEVGRAIRDSKIPREDIFVITKIYPTQYDNPEEAIDMALEKLDIDYIDMMLLHHPGDGDVKAYKAMEKYVKDGKIKSLGLSNYYVSELSDFLNSNKITEKSNHQTIDNYLSMLEKSFIVYKANRTDVRNKSLLKTLGKYYISDTGIRNIILGFRNINEGHLLENVVYLELLRRGYSVNIGKSGDFEVDFVAENPNDIKYYQVAQTLANEEVKEREIRSLESISDNYEKIILTMDKTINKDYNGIKVMNIIDWLLNSD